MKELTDELALELTLKVWEQLFSRNLNGTSPAVMKTTTYTKLLKEHGLERTNRSSCFLCDKYYNISDIRSNPCKSCPLSKLSKCCMSIHPNPYGSWLKINISMEEQHIDDLTEYDLSVANMIKALKECEGV